jgi:hypothetical protein
VQRGSDERMTGIDPRSQLGKQISRDSLLIKELSNRFDSVSFTPTSPRLDSRRNSSTATRRSENLLTKSNRFERDLLAKTDGPAHVWRV